MPLARSLGRSVTAAWSDQVISHLDTEDARQSNGVEEERERCRGWGWVPGPLNSHTEGPWSEGRHEV